MWTISTFYQGFKQKIDKEKEFRRLTLCGYAKCHETLVVDPAKNDVRIEPKKKEKKNR